MNIALMTDPQSRNTLIISIFIGLDFKKKESY